jgi:hypothetical protein
VGLARRAVEAAACLEFEQAAQARRRLARLRPRLEAAIDDARSTSTRFGLAVGLDACLEQSSDRDEHLDLLDRSAQRVSDPDASVYLRFRAARVEFLRGYRESALQRLDALSTASRGDLGHEIRLVQSAALRYLGHADRALAITDQALRASTSPWIEMRAQFHRACALLVLERLDDAEAAARSALTATLPLRAARQRALVFTLLALHATAADRPALAGEYANEAAARFAALGDRLMAGKAIACLARSQLDQAQPHARRTLARAHELASATGDRGSLTSAVLLHAEHVGENARARLYECLWDNEALGLGTLVDPLRDAVTRLDHDARHELVLGQYRACLVEGRTRRAIDLARHEKARRVLRRLADARIAGEGPLPVEALLVAAWPGERLVATSGQNRVYATIRFLRRAGLEDVLRSCSGGYELTCPVRVQA